MPRNDRLLRMVALLTSLALGWHLEKKLSPIPLVTAILVVIFGGLTLYLHNDTFIKVKLTVLYVIFGTTLLCAGLALTPFAHSQWSAPRWKRISRKPKPIWPIPK